MNQLSPYSFEELVVLAFRRADNISKAKSSGYSRDGGFDGYARTKGETG
ncbi:restriction endonuclease (plasmid) [Vibrio alginolyticus]|nr:restriction endonuclease [Vibrio alginolyticus]